VDDLELFSAVQRLVQTKSWYFFQNKVDLLEERLKTHPLKNYFNDIGDIDTTDKEACIKYLRHKFKAKWIGENIQFTATSTLDQKQMSAVIQEMEKDFITKILAASNLF